MIKNIDCNNILKIHSYDESFINALIMILLSKRATSNVIDYNNIALIEYGLKILFENKKISSNKLDDLKISEIPILIDEIDRLRILKEKQVEKSVLGGNELPQYSKPKDQMFAHPGK